MEKYTAKQYAEMYGGHTVTEEAPKGLEFMQTLGEARMFRSKDQIKREGARNSADHLFATLMSLYTMSQDYKYAPVAKEYARMLMDKVRIPEPQIKRFLNQVKNGQVNQSQMQQFLFKLERDLKIQDPKLKATRRLVQNWPNLSSQQQQLAGNQLNRYYRMFARRSDMAPLFTSYAKDSNFLLDRGGKGRIAKQVLRKVGAFAAGYAIGKAIPS